MDASLASTELDLGAGATQGLSVADLFRRGRGGPFPVLHPLDVPVRAIVMPLLDKSAGRVLLEAVRRDLVPLLPAGGAWMQSADLLHSTIYHASTHMDPVAASTPEVDGEVAAVAGAARDACAVRAVLERVVVTRGGTVLACWQVAAGEEPAALRRALAAALPRASRQQVVTDTAILHTTLARIVEPPALRGQAGGRRGGGAAGGGELLRRAAAEMTRRLCGLEVTLSQLWYVEEQDKLALALGGRLTIRNIALECRAGSGERGGLLQ